uniref:Coluporin-22 n=1 Tax=Colubraria reticulata TaxID=604273 RepID=A0A499RI45_9CAEN|nr:coluporin-22 [Colubraria reticulata]
MVLQFPGLKTVMLIFLFVIGHETPPVMGKETTPAKDKTPTASVAEPDVVSAAAANSVDHTKINLGGLEKLAEKDYKVTAVIQVENWTRYPLIIRSVELYSGITTSSATSILPCKREAFALRKPAHLAKGTSGTVSWEVEGVDRFFVIMWSVPFDELSHSNWMGLGMTEHVNATIPAGNTWFELMYHKESTPDLRFQRKEYYHHTGTVELRNDDFTILGMMTTDKRAVITVTFLPHQDNYEYLAPDIRWAAGLDQNQ